VAVFVVDVSKWDGAVSVPKLKAAGVGAVIVKCGGGDVGLYADSRWESNYANCKSDGMPVGAYWYMGATTVARAKEEAAYCIRLLKGKQFEYPIYVDVEERAHQQMSVHQPGTLAKVICAFTDALEAAGYYVGVYSWKWLLEPCGSKVAALDWWVCAWTKAKPCDCGMWQFGGETNMLRPTTVAGYPNMDQSYAYKDYPSITGGGEPTVLSVPEKIAQVSEHFAAHAAHGYSQYERGTGSAETVKLSDGSLVTISGHDIDCSDMVRQCVNVALSGSYKRPITYMWTGTEDAELTAQGFKRMAFDRSKVRRGDILWREGHTGVAVGSAKQAEAFSDENGGLGGRSGDQTGREVAINPLSSNWSRIYRYGNSAEPEVFPVSQTIKFKAKSRVHTQPKVKSEYTYTYQPGETVNIDGLLVSEGYAWGTYVGSKGSRRYVILGSVERIEK